MMNEYEVQVYIDTHLKGIEHHYNSSTGTHLYENMKDMAIYLRKEVALEEWSMVRKIFSTAEHLYERGNSSVKNAIENVFVFSFSSIMPTDKQKRLSIHAIIPCSLYSAYVQQIFRSRN